MPELPEVEIQRRMLNRASQGQTLLSVEPVDSVRFEGDPSLVEGGRIKAWRRRGKYLICETEGGALLSHLGMTGQWILNAPKDRRHQRVRLHFSAGDQVALVDPRRFGWTWITPLDDLATHPRLISMGPEPLEPSFDADALKRALGLKKSKLKTRLLDQKVIAGLGNIAVSDLCWRAEVHPHRSCATLSTRDHERITEAIKDHVRYVIEVEAGDEITYLGYEGAVNPFLCYGRKDEPCPRCGTPFLKGELSGRATYWCPKCQPAP